MTPADMHRARIDADKAMRALSVALFVLALVVFAVTWAVGW